MSESSVPTDEVRTPHYPWLSFLQSHHDSLQRRIQSFKSSITLQSVHWTTCHRSMLPFSSTVTFPLKSIKFRLDHRGSLPRSVEVTNRAKVDNSSGIDVAGWQPQKELINFLMAFDRVTIELMRASRELPQTYCLLAFWCINSFEGKLFPKR